MTTESHATPNPDHAHHGGEGSIPVVGAHGVKFEGSDISPGPVYTFGLAVAGLVAIAAFVLTGFYAVLSGLETGKQNDLPPAAADKAATWPQEPRLEAIDDIRKKNDTNFELLPKRADRFFDSQETLLDKGDKDHLPIQQAIAELAGKLPAEKKAAPTGFSRRLPSRASAGRVETGGQ
jgi:hypothetical protein